MEKIIFILLPIAYFLYSAYLNFKKEKEKAAKRISENPHIPQNAQSATAEAKPPQMREDTTDVQAYLEQRRLEREKLRNEAENVNKADKLAVKDYYNPEVPSAQVMAGRLIHQKHHHQFEFPPPLEDDRIDFDIRSAIIYQVILNRPNY
ncbi:hypothetical protein I5M32_14815 [Pedobacter sp. SD-b]|uniref:Uncharacterized protein n=1 Tax=Pedobacter segetis TaxID=2793069 RepID=A0ABS1BN92_9SPHI|nr:hypothetical protein [Pedobacter segetis]MBK0384237.1 hypothetical protein [Pedobacter segetis]